MISYLNAHKWSLINADQKEYVLAKYNLFFNVITAVLKIIVLQLTHNYIVYLIIELGVLIVQNICNGQIVTKRYPYIKMDRKIKVDKEVKDNLIKNVKALFFHNVGSWCVYGTDNILISTFISIKTAGLYSNYLMITSQVSALIDPIVSGIGASIGNLIATEEASKTYKVFKTTYLVNFWIYSVSVIFLYNLIQPFIEWWIGSSMLLGNGVLIIILINLYIKGLRNSILIFKYKAGLFDNDKYITLLEAIVNLGMSLILVKPFGLLGIFMGTTISTLALPFWVQPKLVYKYVFNEKCLRYFRRYLEYLALTLFIGTITTGICNLINLKFTLISLIIKGLICILIPCTFYLIVFLKTEEFQYLFKVMLPIIKKLRLKINRQYNGVLGKTN